ncbi:MAG: hypothetical protein WAM14_00370 [Candidatus Nitrosopolaris sp.]
MLRNYNNDPIVSEHFGYKNVGTFLTRLLKAVKRIPFPILIVFFVYFDFSLLSISMDFIPLFCNISFSICMDSIVYSGLVIGHTSSAAEQVAQWAVGAKVCKAFPGFQNMVNPKFNSAFAVVFVWGETSVAKRSYWS